MITNQIDKFRKDFFDKIIQEDIENQTKIKEKQRQCFHKYNIIEFERGEYQQRICSKCDKREFKRKKIWHGIAFN